MTMRKVSLFAALVVAMAAVSCVKEMNVETPDNSTDGPVTFEASFGVVSKAVLEAGETESKVSWEAEDQVSVLAGEGNYLYVAQTAGYTTTLAAEATGAPAGGTYYAVYPYDENAVLEGNVITTSLPATQTAVLNSFSSHLSVAQAVENSFTFRNVCGLVKVNVASAGVTKVTFAGNSNENVAGAIKVTVSGTPTWEVVEGATTLELVPAGDATELARGDYYLAVLPQTFAAGITVTAYKGENAWDVRKTSTSLTIERSDMKNSNPFGVVGSGTEADPYLLDSALDLVEMRALAPVGGETWFKMTKDIDLTGVNWIPVNYDEGFTRKIHFDGGNFTISNLTCDKTVCGADYASFFGVLYGTCKNLKFDNAKITSTNGCGVLGGYVGTTGLPAVVENVTITNSSVENKGAATGGVCGNAREAKFTNVSFQGTVTGAGQDLGGFVGKLSSTYNEFTNCTVKATVITTFGGNARCGGFIGWNSSTTTTITNCKVLDGSSLTYSGTLSKAGESTCGGFIGYGDTKGATLTITGCSADIDVNAGTYGQRNSCFIGQLGYASTVTITNSSAKGNVEGSQNYFGGMIGRMASTNKTTISNCHFEGKVKGASGVGGLVGAVEDTAVLTVSDSYATGTITNTANNCGGIVGLVGSSVEVTGCYFSGTMNVSGYGGGIAGGVATASPKCEISRSYTTGTLTASSAYNGGVIGAVQGTASGMVVTDCWSSMDVTAKGQQCGGLVGTTTSGMTIRNCFTTGDIESKTSGNAGIIGRVAKSSTISGCIAWNEKLTCGRTTNDVYAPGAIAGCVQGSGTYEKCWRRPDMNFVDAFMVLSDQDDIVGGVPPAASYNSTTTQSAYHGKAAAAGSTISSVAKTIGWDETVWDLSGDVPALK